MGFKVARWQLGGRVNDAEERYDLLIVPREPEHVRPGALVAKNLSMCSCYPRATWEPDRAMAQHIHEVEGWLLDERGQIVDTPSGKWVWDPAKVCAHTLMDAVFQHLRANPWITAVLWEMLHQRAYVEWASRVDPAAQLRFYEACVSRIARRKRWAHSCNCACEYYFKPEDRKHFALLKLEGGLNADFPDLHDSHDRGERQVLSGFDYWIQRLQWAELEGQHCIFEGFGEEAWGPEKLNQYTRIHAALSCLFDAYCLRHVQRANFWNYGSPWHECYDELRALGEPVDPPRRIQEVWIRQFEHGLLMVNPAHYVNSKRGETIPAYDYVIG